MKLKVILTHCSAYKARRFNPYKRARPKLLQKRAVDDHDLLQSDIGLQKCFSSEKEMTLVSTNIEGTGTLYPLDKGNRNNKTDQPSLRDDLAAKQSGTLLGGNTDDDSCVIIGYSPRRDKPSDLHNKNNGNSSHKDKGGDPKCKVEFKKKETLSVSDGDATSGIADKKLSPCDTLDFLFTHSEVDESNKKYRTWSELETSEGKSDSIPPRQSYIPTDQAWWYAKNVIATGRDIIYRPLADEWKERMDEWLQLTRLINESETRRLVPTEEYPTHVCEWLARVDFRHECVRQKIDYTRPKPKSLREKPGFCARHRPYVRKTRNHREALTKVGRMDLNRVQFIDNF
ncbi:uncharacterized protein LOC133181403 [Saccostrea echinata]|uniref:uncharacterized protein LOC133181403 n=1 Tax=Saccostrea echinata TaxID=191078 RepID=UPI002A80620C|nr:uncharacterized protein LOC133181403 [Saccostrea echinata]